MSADPIGDYLAGVDEPRRTALERLRSTIASLIPDAEEGLSYGVPVFRLAGKPIAGFSAAKHHLSYLPHSGDVLSAIDPADLDGFETSKGAVKFTPDTPLPAALVRTLIAARRDEADL